MKAINIAVLAVLLIGVDCHSDDEKYIRRETSEAIKSATSRWTPYEDALSHPFGHLTRKEMK